MRSIASTLVSLLLLAATAQAADVRTLAAGEGLRDVVIGADGKLWLFTTANFNPTSEVVVGSDGRFWFGTATGVAAVDINGNLTSFATGRPVPSVAAAPYGGVWYARTTPRIGYVDGRGDASERAAPTATPYDIAVAADGTVWLTQMYAANAVFRIDTSGAVTTLQLPVRCFGGRIAAAADATVWITSPESSTVVHLDAGGRLLELVNVPQDVTWTARPMLASDGALWLGERNGLLRIAGGTTTRYPLAAPSFCANAFYRYVPRVQAEDGSLWISRELVASVTTDGPQACKAEPSAAEAQTIVTRFAPDRPTRRRTLR
jgi:streptogramin lyase